MTRTRDEQFKNCPFCGGEARKFDLDDGGSCISCTKCLASSNVEYEFKENFVSNWNRRATAPADTAMLDWLESHNGHVYPSTDFRTAVVSICHTDELVLGQGPTLRDAIRAAMKAELQ
ncbi:Lar family restriction alleviation protein [Acetobacter sp. DsW_063]|uniref:Lar family restriction alleviation protein n=1 Tax=Acetobacter sp. DsW_063 TaxID=1514894 RepID=UPI000A3A1AF7|nr:Lar family restriction alleviation protein [Acetobacter sp. DsW_063]